jgi:uncharacterized protein (DUF1501 family)
MYPTRRDFLRRGLGSATLLTCASSVPGFLARSAAALDGVPRDAKGRILVVLELTGGNDGLNTVVPYRNDIYRKLRPTLKLTTDRVLKVDDHTGLHPALGGFERLLQNRQLAIVQSVGYPNPNRSHFESMAIWQTANLKPSDDSPGWLARQLDLTISAPGRDAPGLHIGNDLLPQALTGGERKVPSFGSLEQFRRRLGVPSSAGHVAQRATLDAIAGEAQGGPGSLLQFVERSAVLTYASSARLEDLLQGSDSTVTYPGYGLAQRLRLIAQLVKAGLTTSIYYTQLGSFDTHANQLDTHANLLREVGESLAAFFEDMTKAGDAQRVLVLVFSEFGRRLGENASGGTDHGTAAPVFLLGGSVMPGLHGCRPDLQNLVDGDPKHAVDFRCVYATLLDQWLNCPSEKVLAGKFAHLGLLRNA